MSNRTLTDVAFDVMSKRKKEIPFAKLWEEICKEQNYNETQAMNKIASFYSALMLDARFTAMPDNKWDLKMRHTFSETFIDTSTFVIDDDIVKEDEKDYSHSDEEGSDSFERENEEDDVY